MAERRMFTKKITDDDHFLNLSSSAQALYLHLSMNADDDGFCNQITASMFKAHASVTDLEALLKNRYIYQFDSGVIVIKHWRMANALRKDRYTPTAFKNEMAMLKVGENGAYTFPDNTDLVAERLPNGCQMVAERLPQVRLGKDSIGKDSIDINKNTNINKEIVTKTTNRPRVKFVKPTVEEIEAFAKEQNLRNLDAQYFYNYYESNGWMVGKNYMKDWKATAKNWNRRELKNKTVIKMPDYMREQADAKTFRELEEEGKCPF